MLKSKMMATLRAPKMRAIDDRCVILPLPLTIQTSHCEAQSQSNIVSRKFSATIVSATGGATGAGCTIPLTKRVKIPSGEPKIVAWPLAPTWIARNVSRGRSRSLVPFVGLDGALSPLSGLGGGERGGELLLEGEGGDSSMLVCFTHVSITDCAEKGVHLRRSTRRDSEEHAWCGLSSGSWCFEGVVVVDQVDVRAGGSEKV